jgi:DNA-binding transcriptional ArsR family regulator
MTVDAVLDALGDPTRRVIFTRLQRHASDATTMAGTMPVTRSAVARHLAVLKGAGLVTAHRDGTRQIYALRIDGLGVLDDWISALRRMQR